MSLRSKDSSVLVLCSYKYKRIDSENEIGLVIRTSIRKLSSLRASAIPRLVTRIVIDFYH